MNRDIMESKDVTKEIIEALKHALIDEMGREINNPVPLEVEVGPKKVCINDEIRRVVATEISKRAMEMGKESYEEANDFDVDDDFEKSEIRSQYEIMDDDYPEMVRREFEGEKIEEKAVEMQDSEVKTDVKDEGE